MRNLLDQERLIDKEIEEELEDLDPFIRVNIGVYEFLFPKFHPDSNTN